jgi:FkbM family methyltransferase
MTPAQEAVAGAIRTLLSPLSRLAHWILDRFELPILSGANKGRKWHIGSGVIACWLGTYETVEVSMFAALIEPGAVVYDLGAHSGYFTLVASRLAGEQGKVFAAEAMPTTAAALRHHLEINDVKNVTVVERAVGNRDDATIAFGANAGGMGYGAALAGGPQGLPDELSVRTITLDTLVAEGAPIPDVVKMDVEAMEAAVMEGASAVLKACKTAWLISMHEHEVAVRTIEALRASGHDVYNLDGPRVPFGTPASIDYPQYFWVVLALPAGRKAPIAGRWTE